MDRRSFLKRSIAATAAAAIALVIDNRSVFLQAMGQTGVVQITPMSKTSNIATNRLIYGGNLFTGYGHGRESVDVSELRLRRTRLTQTGFSAGWAADSNLRTQEFC
jgi:hypothetical protein